MDKTVSKQLIAELIGTFTLTFVVLASVNNPSFPIPTPFLAALTLGVFVATIGKISGCHINPAVTLALLSVKEISMQKALRYIVAQILGAALASMLLKIAIPNLTLVAPNANLNTIIFETLGAAIFIFGIASVVYKKTADNLAPPIIGLSLLLGISAAAIGSNAILNPAVALAIGSTDLVYILAPILGGVIAIRSYRHLINN
jgi:aquaporin Z